MKDKTWRRARIPLADAGVGRGVHRSSTRPGWTIQFVLAFRFGTRLFESNSTVLQQQSQKPVIWCGDLNCAHQEIDIWNPEGNRRSAGFTDEERASFSQTLRECALLDTFCWLHPSVRAYSYIGHRHVQNYLQNRGWRLDYFCCSANAASRIVDSYMRFDIEIHARAYQQREVERHQVRRLSDHCPVVFLFRVG
ncbi:DNA-(apurinic or apyrimidinic site) lyase [Cyanidiococcus yangmingshanensis]|uniref:DNA-(Apurinic or apyrimidinic site) lyase n=1 Tax=Cyanidiococcus yangmingshanensis TaxID=2690220 RepID=A0A7J7IC26_9RHOD|nr:DNA-(apurinic or apyrimidinic site) lyase [Cyanidiococcus yangmingshanensis]